MFLLCRKSTARIQIAKVRLSSGSQFCRLRLLHVISKPFKTLPGMHRPDHEQDSLAMDRQRIRTGNGHDSLAIHPLVQDVAPARAKRRLCTSAPG